MYVDPGSTGGSFNGFTYTNVTSLGSTPIITGLKTGTSSISYDAGAFNYHGITLNFTPWDLGGSESMWWDLNPYEVVLTFKDINGHVITTDTFNLEYPRNQTEYKEVAGVHSIEFFSSSYNAATPRFYSLDISAVPEPATYGMLLAGLGMMAAVARRRKQA
ncbi:PEP-CTERM sorting domain-containing protein [Pseudoduganella sp. FT55W]|uniref:PEP-CTERM sorting domain-containing protein n=2 Tax=Duganella rivi TaxID=2666083 RepID=A0A7X4GPE0_9BURK|nr:PEP-CTERM sorting domain-containing protein [Duganella rivi]